MRKEFIYMCHWPGCWINQKSTQGNYATQDSCGMCHLMPWRHLPEWREEEDERAFVHCGSSGPEDEIR